MGFHRNFIGFSTASYWKDPAHLNLKDSLSAREWWEKSRR
jgi:hypothetical protein